MIAARTLATGMHTDINTQHTVEMHHIVYKEIMELNSLEMAFSIIFKRMVNFRKKKYKRT